MKYRERASAVILHQGKILGFDAVDPFSGRHYVFLPGGGIERGETPVRCAERESREETGFEVALDPRSEIIREYAFFWDGEMYWAKTYFYRGHLLHTTAAAVNDVAYNKGAVWIPRDDVPAVFGYTDEIREAILRLT